MIRYSLPYPPSLNNLFRNVKHGRVKTEGYERWIRLAQGHILEQGRKRLHGFVSVSVALVRPDKRKRDLDNSLKPLLDLLVGMSIIDDDSLIQRISIQWVESGPACSVSIAEAISEVAA